MPKFKVTLTREYKEWHEVKLEIEVDAPTQDEAEEKAIEETGAYSYRYEISDHVTDTDNDYDPVVVDVEELDEGDE